MRGLRTHPAIFALVAILLTLPAFALERSLEGWQLQGLQPSGDGSGSLQISSSRSRPPTDFLFLGFDQDTPAFLRDLSGNFRIRRSQYVRVPEAKGGDASALFNRRESSVSMDSPPELWPGSGPLESFQISFFFRPAHLYRRNELFSRIGYLDGQKRGIEIVIQDGFLHVELHNLFSDLQRNLHSYALHSADRIVLNQWYLVLFRYDASSGRIALFLNGREQQIDYAEENGQVLPAVNDEMDRSPIQIAGHYSGWMDEFRISRLDATPDTAAFDRAKYDPKSGRIYQDRSIGLSPVQKYTQPIARLKLQYAGNEPAGSMLQVQYRLSNQPFSQNTSEYSLPWKTMHSRNQEIAWNDPAYIQWKVTMQPDPSGSISPTLNDLKVDVRPVRVPARPTGVRIIPELSTDHSLCIEWNRNSETEVEKKGGYRIHLGAHSGRYVAIVRYTAEQKMLRAANLDFPLTRKETIQQKVEPATIARLKRKKIRLILDRSLLENNRRWLNRREAYPYLESGRTFFVGVSAYVHPDAPSEISNEALLLLPNP